MTKDYRSPRRISVINKNAVKQPQNGVPVEILFKKHAKNKQKVKSFILDLAHSSTSSRVVRSRHFSHPRFHSETRRFGQRQIGRIETESIRRSDQKIVARYVQRSIRKARVNVPVRIPKLLTLRSNLFGSNYRYRQNRLT